VRIAPLTLKLPRERLWGLVVESVDAPTAGVCVLTAAVLAAEQASEAA
jgi:hypothetical protein